MAERRTIKKKASPTQLKVADGKVEVVVTPQEEIEVTSDAVEKGPPTISFNTPAGQAVYKYIGNCTDCGRKGEELEVFACTSGNVRADEQVGVQLAAFWREGRAAVPLCQNCYSVRQGGLPKTEVIYRTVK